MELKPNMYVRTKRRTLQPPQIARIRNISKDSGYKNQYYIELDKNLIPSYEYHIYKEDIENAKYSLIELVKVGDYVNGVLITNISEDNKGKYVFGYSKDGFEGEIWFYNNEIETIVTKEQFEAMQYEIK